jgi:hypothetical protein
MSKREVARLSCPTLIFPYHDLCHSGLSWDRPLMTAQTSLKFGSSCPENLFRPEWFMNKYIISFPSRIAERCQTTRVPIKHDLEAKAQARGALSKRCQSWRYRRPAEGRTSAVCPEISRRPTGIDWHQLRSWDHEWRGLRRRAMWASSSSVKKSQASIISRGVLLANAAPGTSEASLRKE